MSDTILSLVRRHDPDRFLLSLFAPAQLQPAIWSLLAFNHEIAKTRESVSDTTLGLIRLQWWREAIAEIYTGKKVREHEVVHALAETIRAHNLSQDAFDRLIYAREFDVEGVSPATLEGLLKYCQFTNQPLLEMILKILGIECNETIVVDISKRFGLIGSIRAVPYRLSQGFNLLPLDILSNHNFDEQSLQNKNSLKNLPKVISELMAAQKSIRNDSIEENMPKIIRKMHKMCDLYAHQIEKVNYDVLHPALTVRPPFFALRILIGV